MNLLKILPVTEDRTFCFKINKKKLCFKTNGLTAVLAALLLGFLIYNLIYAAHLASVAFSYDYAIDSSENSLIASVFRAKDIGFYFDFYSRPYLPTLYPPVFYLAALGLDNLLGPGVASGRLVSFISLIGTAFIFAGIVFKKLGNMFLGAVVFVLFLMNDTICWGLLYRTEMLYLFFIAAAVCLGVLKDTGAKMRTFSLAFLSLAFFTNLAAVLQFLIIVFFWFLADYKKSRNTKLVAGISKTAVLSLAFLFFSAALSYGLHLLTGSFYFKNILFPVYYLNRGGLTGAFGLLFFYLRLYWPFILYVLVFSLTERKKLKDRRVLNILSIGLLFNILFMFMRGWYNGYDPGYALEPYLWLFYLVVWTGITGWKSARARLIFLLVLVFYAGMSFPVSNNPLFKKHTPPFFTAEQLGYNEIEKDSMVKLMKHSESDIISADQTIPIILNKPPVLDIYTMGFLNKGGKWETSEFEEDVEKGRYKYIAIKTGHSDLGLFEGLAGEYFKRIGRKMILEGKEYGVVWDIYEYCNNKNN